MSAENSANNNALNELRKIDSESAWCFKCKKSTNMILVRNDLAHNLKNLLKIGQCSKCGTGVSRVSKQVATEEQKKEIALRKQ